MEGSGWGFMIAKAEACRRYRVKFSSIKKHLLLIKQKQKKIKNTKTYLNETKLENQ